MALWEKRVMEERTSEIFKRLQKKQMEVAREAEEAEHKQEQLWREQGTPRHGSSHKPSSAQRKF